MANLRDAVITLLTEQTLSMARALVASAEPVKAFRLVTEIAPSCVIDTPAARAFADDLRRHIDQYFDDDAYLRRYTAYDNGHTNVAPFADAGLLTLTRAVRARELVQTRGAGRVMDIGSGDGTLDKALLEDSPDIAMYLSELLPIGGEVTRQLNDLFPGRVHMAPRMDTEEVLLTAPMDVILCCEVIEHVTDPGALLRNMARNLALDGQIYVTTPDCAAWVERKVLDELGKDDTWYHHVRAYSPASLAREAIAAGFTPTVFRDQGGSLIMTASLTRDFRSAETHEMEPPAVMACLSAREQLPPPGSVIRSKVRLVESAGLSVDVLDGVILETL